MNWKDDSLFPGRLRQLRERFGLTQSEFATRVDVSRGAISMYEAGDRVPDIRFLDKVIEEFECSYDYLMGKSENTIPAAKVLSDVLAPLNDDALRLILEMPTELNLVAAADSTSLYCLILYLAIYASRAVFEPSNSDEEPFNEQMLDLLEKLDSRIRNTFEELVKKCRICGYGKLTSSQMSAIREFIDSSASNAEQLRLDPSSTTVDILSLLSVNQYEKAKEQLRQLDNEFRREHHAP